MEDHHRHRPLIAGTNRVRLTSIGYNGPNIDSMSVSGTATEPTPAERIRQAVDFAARQLRRTAAEVPTSTYVNYTNSNGTWHVMDRIAWESGFLPASMWQMYNRTGDTFFRDQAAARTTPLEVSTDKPYDTSFIIYKPFKPLYDQTNDPQYRQVMLDAANAKATHFHPTAGVFQGWDRASTSGDPRAQVGFYVDLMADLELFIWAAKETGNADWLAMANRHAHKTADHLIRPDGSTIQWGYFDPATGDFVGPEQYQGYDESSTWTRGQAWAIYGYALAYRELGEERFLEMARKTADWYIAHLPADKVPYWDFNDPRIPSTYRDSSAAAIAASGLLDLAKQLSGTPDGARYRSAAEATLLSLSSSAYLAEGTPDRSILRHAALNVPRNVGNNVGLIVGDYFFLEAIDRYFQ